MTTGEGLGLVLDRGFHRQLVDNCTFGFFVVDMFFRRPLVLVFCASSHQSAFVLWLAMFFCSFLQKFCRRAHFTLSAPTATSLQSRRHGRRRCRSRTPRSCLTRHAKVVGLHDR